MNLTEQVKARARELGADLVGIAPVERFAGAPLRMSPEGLLPGARCVVVCGIHHLDAAVELGGDPTPHECGPYHSQTDAQNPMLDDLSFQLGRFLEARGFRTVPISASNIWRYNAYKDLAVDFAPDLAHRYAAAAAGLAEIGWSGLALTPEFGPRCRFVSVVTDAPLEPSPMYAGEPLCDKCMQCVETCPTDAFRKEVKRTNTIEIGGRTFKFPETNKWRCAWAENFALNLAHRIPDTVDETVILRTLERYDRHAGELGCCLQFCMNPQNRTYDKDYCRPPRRKKSPATSDAKRLLRDVEAILEPLDNARGRRSVADVWAVSDVSAFDDEPLVNPSLHLPDAATVISLGFRVPRDCDRND
ncbi:MAG TPA: 4Fe-4S binding protein, partial [Planctomycetota bacterium]|nr:4Fe-4S binding protein [Planctomycetota bacterium]